MVHIYRETDPVSGRWTGNSSGIDLSAFQIDQNFYEVLQDTSYSVNDTFSVNGTLGLAIFPHTSQASFSYGANDGLGHNYYVEMLALPGSSLPTGGAADMMLAKVDGHDFHVYWKYPVPIGGAAGTVLKKITSADFNMAWSTESLEQLSDVISVSPLLTGQFLGWNGSHWQNATIVISDIGDFLITSPTSGDILSFDGSHWINEPFPTVSLNSSNSWLAAPTGNVSTTETAMGLGASPGNFLISPSGSGVFLVWIAGVVLNSTLAGDGVTITGRHGTGTAPANGATTGLGTQFSIPQHFVASTPAGQQGFVVMGKLVGLTVGVSTWIDLSIIAVTAGGATVKDVQFVAVEV